MRAICVATQMFRSRESERHDCRVSDAPEDLAAAVAFYALELARDPRDGDTTEELVGGLLRASGYSAPVLRRAAMIASSRKLPDRPSVADYAEALLDRAEATEEAQEGPPSFSDL